MKCVELVAGDEQEHRRSTSKNRELEMARAGGGRRRESIYAGPVVPVCGSNLDYRWASNLGLIHQPVLKLWPQLVPPTGTGGRPLVLVGHQPGLNVPSCFPPAKAAPLVVG
jgi:hypothetical protein